MGLKVSSKPFNIAEHKRILRDIAKAKPGANDDDLYKLIGIVTTTFEMCESHMLGIVRHLRKEGTLTSLVVDKVHSRQLRADILDAYLGEITPKRPTKQFQKIVKLFAEYRDLGAQRDQIAHSITMDFGGGKGPSKLLLVPPTHASSKQYHGLPKYHYDQEMLTGIANRLITLQEDLVAIRTQRGFAKLERMIKSQRKSRGPS
jgi:hypothetical protein